MCSASDCLGQMGVRRALRDYVPVLMQGLRPAFFPEVPVERRGHDVTLISTGSSSPTAGSPADSWTGRVRSWPPPCISCASPPASEDSP